MPERYPFDVATIAIAVKPPPLDDLYGIAARRRQRRIAVAACVLVLMVLVGVALPLAPSGSSPAPALGGPSPAPPVHGASFVNVLDDHTAVAVAEHSCEDLVSFTTDAGKHWSPWRTPVPVVSCDPMTPDLDGIAWPVVMDADSWGLTVAGQLWVTVDAGVTWQTAADAVRDVAAFPAGVTVADCGSGSCFGVAAQPLAVDPRTHQVYRLQAQPGGGTITNYMSAGGVLWATVWGAAQGPTAARSTDGGATWSTHKVSGTTGGLNNLYALDATHAWFAYGPDHTHPLQVVATADAGTTWQLVTTDLPPGDAVLPLTGTPDGKLLVADSEPAITWASDDGGAHFAQSSGPPSSGNGDTPFVEASHGFAYTMVYRPDTLYVTSDAKTWTAWPLP